MRCELVTKSTPGGCDQFEPSPEAIEQEFRPAECERRQTDRLKTNYRVDMITCKEKYGIGIDKLGINKVNISSRLLEVINAIVILQTNSNE